MSRGKDRVNKLKVVNDATEGGVSLVQSFNSVLTKQKEQKQYLLQVVEKHRRDFPDATKSTLIGDDSAGIWYYVQFLHVLLT